MESDYQTSEVQARFKKKKKKKEKSMKSSERGCEIPYEKAPESSKCPCKRNGCCLQRLRSGGSQKPT